MIADFINDGNEYPTVGISFGLSSIYELLKEKDIFNEKSDIDIYVIPMDTEIESLKIANNLRNLGYKVEVEMITKKLKKSLDYANKERIPYVIIIGENEIQNGYFYLKDMNNNIEYKVTTLDELKKYLD